MTRSKKKKTKSEGSDQWFSFPLSFVHFPFLREGVKKEARPPISRINPKIKGNRIEFEFGRFDCRSIRPIARAPAPPFLLLESRIFFRQVTFSFFSLIASLDFTTDCAVPFKSPVSFLYFFLCGKGRLRKKPSNKWVGEEREILFSRNSAAFLRELWRRLSPNKKSFSKAARRQRQRLV